MARSPRRPSSLESGLPAVTMALSMSTADLISQSGARGVGGRAVWGATKWSEGRGECYLASRNQNRMYGVAKTLSAASTAIFAIECYGLLLFAMAQFAARMSKVLGKLPKKALFLGGLIRLRSQVRVLARPLPASLLR